jgi:exopolysaccharide production protein ExoZ
MLFSIEHDAKRKNDITSIQYLRALAALAVLVFHACTKAGADFSIGQAGVDLFFVISGFLMVLITGNHTSAGTFLLDRILRIAPLYWIATLTLVALHLIGFAPNLSVELSYVIQSLLFIPVREPTGVNNWPVLVPGWSLVFEIFFYALFAFVIAKFRVAWRVPVLSIILVGLVGLGLSTNSESPIFQTYTDPMLLEFLAGTWIGIFATNIRKIPNFASIVLLVMSVALLILLNSLLPISWRVVSFGLPACIILIAALALEAKAPTSLFGKLFNAIGDSSYSLYLWHGMAISVTSKIAASLEFPVMAEITLGVIGGLALGFASYWIIERPIRHWAAEFKARRSAVVDVP